MVASRPPALIEGALAVIQGRHWAMHTPTPPLTIWGPEHFLCCATASLSIRAWPPFLKGPRFLVDLCPRKFTSLRDATP